MDRYSGVTLDYYDDRGEFLKTHFPTADEVPGFIKTAVIRDRDSLPNEAFALVATDEGRMMRKFACHDPGTTAMSVMYFMEHRNRLPEEAVKTAAANLVNACMEHDILPPAQLIEASGGEKLAAYFPGWGQKSEVAVRKEEEAGLMDITGQRAASSVKTASSNNPENWAVIMPDGSRHYPIQSWDQVKTAEDYFMDNKHMMEPVIRRQFAVKLAAKCDKIGYHAKDEVKETGATTKKHAGLMKMALEMRKKVGGDQEFLDDLFEKQASLDPDVYAEVLHRYDCDSGLDKFWDSRIYDPWESTFGIVKTAERVIFDDVGDRMTEGQLQNLVNNNMGWLSAQFTEHFASEFVRDPIGIFESLPLPQQRIIARLAADAASQGSSEGTEKLSAWSW